MSNDELEAVREQARNFICRETCWLSPIEGKTEKGSVVDLICVECAKAKLEAAALAVEGEK